MRRRVWSAGNRHSVVNVPDLHGLGDAPFGRRIGDGQIPRHAELDHVGSCSSVFDVGHHNGWHDGPRRQPSDSALCRDKPTS